MVYKATQDVVRRVMPLLDQLAVRTVDKARLLQYLSARTGEQWGVLDFLGEIDDGVAEPGGTARVLLFRDRATGAEHRIRYPSCLPEQIEQLVLEEYKRLAMDQPLTMMSQQLFDYFYAESYCSRCRWRGPAHEQIHRECRFAGRPINFEAAWDDDRVVQMS